MSIARTHPTPTFCGRFWPGSSGDRRNASGLLGFKSTQAVCANHLSGLSRRGTRRCGDLRSTRPRNKAVPSCRPTQSGDLLSSALLRVAGGQLCSGSGEGQNGVGPVSGLGSCQRSERGVKSDRLASHLLRVRPWYLVAWRSAWPRGRFQRSVYHEQGAGGTFLLSPPWGPAWCGLLSWPLRSKHAAWVCWRGPKLVSK